MRRFSLDEATELLPRLKQLIDGLRRLRDEAVVKKAQIDRLWQRLGAGEPMLSTLGAEQRELDDLTSRLVGIAKEIESTGCILRDVDLGLVDFPFRARGGATVFLCWRHGEAAIQFWHGTDEGYAGRKPIERLPLEEV